MTQDAVVTKLLPHNMAEVVVTRTTACGGNCGNCESCIFQSELKTAAKNQVGAVPGQRVLIESRSSQIFGAALLVYVMPLALFLLGYALAYLRGWSEGGCIAVSFAGLLLGAALVVLRERTRKKSDQITFDIVALKDGKNA